jgi:hypothetical protein
MQPLNKARVQRKEQNICETESLGTISVVQLTMTIESVAQSENLFVGKCAD